MRIIHIQFKDKKSFDWNILRDGNETNLAVRNFKGQQIVLHHPQLKRTLVRGVYILDQWGDNEKWFTDNDVSMGKMW